MLSHPEKILHGILPTSILKSIAKKPVSQWQQEMRADGQSRPAFFQASPH
jgi:hypothetical protein